VAFEGSESDLLVSGGLLDKQSGYSADVPFRPIPVTGPPSDQTFAELGLMTGAADPMLQFPAGTMFTPYFLLRNISDQPMTITPTLYWMDADGPKFTDLRSFFLRPSQAASLNPGSLMSSSGVPANGSVNLILTVQGVKHGLLFSGGSVDQKNTYVFGVLPQ